MPKNVKIPYLLLERALLDTQENVDILEIETIASLESCAAWFTSTGKINLLKWKSQNQSSQNWRKTSKMWWNSNKAKFCATFGEYWTLLYIRKRNNGKGQVNWKTWKADKGNWRKGKCSEGKYEEIKWSQITKNHLNLLIVQIVIFRRIQNMVLRFIKKEHTSVSCEKFRTKCELCDEEITTKPKWRNTF